MAFDFESFVALDQVLSVRQQKPNLGERRIFHHVLLNLYTWLMIGNGLSPAKLRGMVWRDYSGIEHEQQEFS